MKEEAREEREGEERACSTETPRGPVPRCSGYAAASYRGVQYLSSSSKSQLLCLLFGSRLTHLREKSLLGQADGGGAEPGRCAGGAVPSVERPANSGPRMLLLASPAVLVLLLGLPGPSHEGVQ